jgi:hypothetical protein
MRYPPLKAIEAVKTRKIDSRTRHIAVRFRDFFRCLDANGVETTDEQEIKKITLTPRADRYWDEQNQGRQRIPAAA